MFRQTEAAKKTKQNNASPNPVLVVFIHDGQTNEQETVTGCILAEKEQGGVTYSASSWSGKPRSKG